MVAAEEAFLGARVRALMVRLAEKDSSTEEHTRRVAALAVAIGEQFGLTPARLRAPGDRRPAPRHRQALDPELDPAEAGCTRRRRVRDHQAPPDARPRTAGRARRLQRQRGRLVLDHHERLDGSGYPRGIEADELSLETRILAVCDVYDALVSPRVYRAAWTPERALALLRSETGTAFDADCVEALVHILSPELRCAEPPAQALPKAATGRRLTHAVR